MLHYAQEVFKGLKAYRWAPTGPSLFVSRRRQRRQVAFVGAAVLRFPNCPARGVHPESLRQLIAVDKKLGCPVPAVRRGASASRSSSPPSRDWACDLPLIPLPVDRLAGRCVLQGGIAISV